MEVIFLLHPLPEYWIVLQCLLVCATVDAADNDFTAVDIVGHGESLSVLRHAQRAFLCPYVVYGTERQGH